MMGLKKTGEALAEAFQTLTQNFMKAVDGLSDIMEEWSRTLTENSRGDRRSSQKDRTLTLNKKEKRMK